MYMDSDDRYWLGFWGMAFPTIILVTLVLCLNVPGCVAVNTCLENNQSAEKHILCERVLQSEYKLLKEYPNDEKTSR